MRHARLVVFVACMVMVVTAPGSAAAVPARPQAPPVAGYRDPSFADRCRWHVFGDGERPPWSLSAEDPLCVEYAKRDITVDNGGWLAFVLAEPSRFAVAVPACRYWQRDHWRAQLTTGARPLVTWDGSYWFDKDRGELAGRLANFRVAGVSAGVGDAATALRPAFPALADALSAYGATAGESGLHTAVPAVAGC